MTVSNRLLFAVASALVATALCALDATVAAAQAPGSVPLQGFLTDDAGLPIDGDTPLQLRLYENDIEVYSEIQIVAVDNGAFVVYLGEGALDLSLFRGGVDLSLGVTVGDGEELSPRFALGTAPFAAYAEVAAMAEDAAALGGLPATDYALASELEWTALQNVPADLSDGDDDTLAALAAGCGTGEVATWDGAAWSCAAAAPAITATAPVTYSNGTIGLTMGSGSGLDADTLDGVEASGFAAVGHTHAATEVTGTFPDSAIDAYADLGAEGRLDNNAGDDLLTRSQADGRFVNLGEAPSAHNHDATAITSGTLDVARFDAYGDLSAAGRIDDTASTDLLTRGQADGRYISPGEADTITSAMIAPGTITNSDISDTAAISSDKIGWANGGTAVTSDCGTFVPASICPAGSNDMVSCALVGPGAFCEFDSGCTNLDGTLDNCPGAYDIYIRTF